MRTSRLRTAAAAVLTLTAALVLGACSTGATGAAGAEGGAAGAGDSAAYPVTITHAYGETTISRAPTRVATLGWSDQDFALALGVAPVGAVKITWGGNEKASTPWYDAKLAELGAKEPTRYDDADGAPVEEIAKLRPDLILATNSGLTKDEYTKLSKIAPVVAFPGEAWGTPWQTSLELVGKALGKEKEAAELKKDTEASIAAAATKYPQTKGKTFIFAALAATDTSKIDYYTTLDNRPRLLADLGMVNAPYVEKTSTGKEFFKTVSAEQASTLDADVFITYTAAAGEMQKFLKDPLLGQIPAFRSGAYVDANNQTDALGMSAPSPLSIPWAMDKFVPLVAAAVDRATDS
jgi:iron complex transport system substrate-binding protein